MCSEGVNEGEEKVLTRPCQDTVKAEFMGAIGNDGTVQHELKANTAMVFVDLVDYRLMISVMRSFRVFVVTVIAIKSELLDSGAGGVHRRRGRGRGA